MDPANYWGQIDPTQIVGVTDPLNAYQQAQMQSAQRAVGMAQAQRQLQQQAIGDAALRDALTNPSPQTYQALMIARPEAFQAAKAAYGAMDEQGQRQTLRDTASVYGYLQAGQADQAAQAVQAQIDARKRAGQDTGPYEQFLSAIRDNPDVAKVQAGLMLSAIAGPDKFAEAYGQMGKEQRAQASFPAEQAQAQASLAKTQAETQQITNPRPETASAGIGPDGRPIYYNPKGAPPASGAALTTNNGALDGFVQQIVQSESGGNPTATNDASSATGAAQFLKGTWLPLIQQLHPELKQGKTEQQVLDLRNNPQLAAEATAAYAQSNAQALDGAGLPVNGATLAMAHKLGAQGAQAVLRARPDAPLSQVLPADVIAANPTLAKQTAGQYAQKLAGQFGTAAIDAQPGDPTATGDAFLKTLPPARARMIKAIADGDQPMPANRGGSNPQALAIEQQVLQYDPTASAINLPARQTTRKAFTSGTQGQSIVQANTVGGHLGALDALVSSLGNTGIPFINSAKNAVGQATGNQATQKAVTSFRTLSNTLASELTKFYRSNGGSEKDVQEFRDQLDPSGSPTQIHSAISQMAGAVLSKIAALNDSYTAGMGKVSEGLNLPNINHNAIAQLQRLAGDSAISFGGEQASPPKVATNPQTGARVVFDAASRTWKPG